MAPFISPPNPEEYNQRVWKRVRQIPPGMVATYGQIAALIAPPPGVDPGKYISLGARWVGGAMKGCPDDVPWQRVINSQGKISLPKGGGEEQQRQLLEVEGVQFDDRDRVDLVRYRWPGPETKNGS